MNKIQIEIWYHETSIVQSSKKSWRDVLGMVKNN